MNRYTWCQLEWIVPAGISLFLLCLYSTTVARTHISFADSDEITSLGFLGGVGHPRGFGLLIWLTYLATHLPISIEVAFKANLLAMGLQLLNVVLNYLLIVALLRTLSVPQKHQIIAAAIGSLSLATSALFWFHANVIEKSALAMLLSQLTLLGCLHTKQVMRSTRNLIIFGVLIGLGLGYHEYYLLVLPLVVWTSKDWLWGERIASQGRKSWASDSSHLREKRATVFGQGPMLRFRTVWLSLGIGLGFGLGAGVGLIWWSNLRDLPFSYHLGSDWSDIYAFLTRAAYADHRGSFYWRDTQFQHAGSAVVQYIKQLQLSFSTWFLLLSLAGWVGYVRSRSTLCQLLLGTALLTGPVLMAYLGTTILDPNQAHLWWEERMLGMRMEVLSYPYIALGVGLGMGYMSSRWRYGSWGVIVVVAGLCWQTIQTYPQIDLHDFRVTQQLTRDQLESLPAQALLICKSDYGCFSFLYQHLIEEVRPDVVVMPIAFAFRSQYLVRHPELTTHAWSANPWWFLDLVGTNLPLRPVLAVDLGNDYTRMLGLDQGILFPSAWGQLTQIHASPAASLAHSPVRWLPIGRDRLLPFFTYIQALQRQRLATNGYLLATQAATPSALSYLLEAEKVSEDSFPLVASLKISLMQGAPNASPPTVKTVPFLLGLAKQAFQQADLEEAIWFTQQALVKDPQDTQSIQALMSYLAAAGRHQDLRAVSAKID